MCGICGIAYADPTRQVDRDRLVFMRDLLEHRGPDGAGVYYGQGVGLGHRRLSIIDLEGGSQPLANEDQTVWVTFNGEIYNYRALATDLAERGHHFRTRSDTEVLVHAYEEYGLDFVSRLEGMFAFALHDTVHHRTVLARDHFGIKPLFYALADGGLFFGSEAKAVVAALDRTPTMDSAALQEYLTFRYVAWSRSFFEGIHRLPPGHLAEWEGGRLNVRRYWSVTERSVSESATLPEAADALEALLDRSVQSQLMSDVPLGTFCSGGVDSGLVTAYAARHSTGALHTFSVGFDDPAWDETPLARGTAARFNTQHHVLRVRGDTFAESLSRLIWYHDEPLSHPNSMPLYMLSEYARRYVKVVLTGEGADELFGGYPRYHLARVGAAAARWPRWASIVAGQVARSLPGHRAALVARLLPRTFEDAILLNSAYVDPHVVEALTGRLLDDATAERRRLVHDSVVPNDPLASISRYELQTYLGCALDRMDTMSMASGLEGRVPFLDVPLAEWGLSLPSSLKLSGRSTKRVLKLLAERTLSPEITRGRKSGFGLPLNAWFRSGPLASLLDRLRDPSHPAAVHFDRRMLGALVESHLRGSADHGEILWLLSNVYLWHEVHLGGGDLAPLERAPGAAYALGPVVT
jgi:asparagine synthase (glutamine-hydrolysing)